MELIYKDALLKELGITNDNCEKCAWGDGYGYCTRDSDFTDACDAICTAPTIEERKTGRWIDYIGEDLGVDGQWLRDDGKTVFVQCDQCKSLYVRNFMNHWHWCPRCGCKMEGEQP